MPNGRCRLHGGASTGPRTADGLARIKAARTTHGHYSAEMKGLRALVAELRRFIGVCVLALLILLADVAAARAQLNTCLRGNHDRHDKEALAAELLDRNSFVGCAMGQPLRVVEYDGYARIPFDIVIARWCDLGKTVVLVDQPSPGTRRSVVCAYRRDSEGHQ